MTVCMPRDAVVIVDVTRAGVTWMARLVDGRVHRLLIVVIISACHRLVK